LDLRWALKTFMGRRANILQKTQINIKSSKVDRVMQKAAEVRHIGVIEDVTRRRPLFLF
jgi:hypothetical protein